MPRTENSLTQGRVGPALLRFALPFLRKQKAAKKTAAKEWASEKGKESAAHEAA